MITIAASSDFHGNLPEVTKPFDLMLLAGDLEPAHDHTWSYQHKWYKEQFLPWVMELPFKDEWSKVIFIAGNHSCYLAQEGHSFRVKELEIESNGRLQYLHHEWCFFDYLDEESGEIKNIYIFGTPYCKIFGNWWNMLSDKVLTEKYSEIPSNIDILVSHDSPSLFGLGEIKQRNPVIDAGNRILSDVIEDIKPRYFFSGHIHSGEHTLQDNGFTKMANVSLLDEHYQIAYPILYLTI